MDKENVQPTLKLPPQYKSGISEITLSADSNKHYENIAHRT